MLAAIDADAAVLGTERCTTLEGAVVALGPFVLALACGFLSRVSSVDADETVQFLFVGLGVGLAAHGSRRTDEPCRSRCRCRSTGAVPPSSGS